MIIKMVSVNEVTKQAKEKGLKNYSCLSRRNLECVLSGEKLIKALKKNQVSKYVQSEFPLRQNCQLKHVTDFMIMCCADKNIVNDGDLQYDVKAGELIGVEVAYVKSCY